jgi:antitoxin (DNA-binding transcriptional repressor) of toxin-antitoxin stability system
MRTLSVRELRVALADLEQLVAREGEIVITRGGKPIARILRWVPSHAEFRSRMPRLEVGSEVLIRQDRDQR